jgi:hypothetical protein
MSILFKSAVLMLLLGCSANLRAATSINPTNKHAYGANVGWMDLRGNTNNGVVIGEFLCSGFLYAANVGWIHLGSNAPANGIQYQNSSGTDYGVNHDGQGNLRGFAYGANIGWVNFESNGAPRVDLKTGRFHGSVYSANCGWISLSNAFGLVKTDTIPGGADVNANGLPDAWERTYFGGLGVNPASDADGDGMSNKAEYLAGTNPTNALNNLRITQLDGPRAGGGISLTWSSVPIRCYLIQETRDVTSGWFDSGLGLVAPGGSLTTRSFTGAGGPEGFYRVEAVRPLAP